MIQARPIFDRLSALADPTRSRLLLLLDRHELTVGELCAALQASLGLLAVVEKERHLLLWQNVRIHLDQVENLGNFIELEAVIDPGNDEHVSRERLDQLMRALAIRAEDRLCGSYGELIK